MGWTIELTSAILLTSVTGSILFLGWYIIAFVLDRMGFVNIIYQAMKVVMPFWMFPLSFLILVMDNLSYNTWGGFLFNYTPFAAKMCLLFSVAWMAGAFHYIGKYIIEVMTIKSRYQNAEFVNGPCWHCFEDACECHELDAHAFRVVYSSWDSSPKIFGLLHPTVVLPRDIYTENELEVIYTHELTHYQQKVLRLKHLTAIAYAINFANPLIWLFGNNVRNWGEFACDNTSLIHVGGVRYYFETLLALQAGGEEREMLRANLVGKPCDLEARIIRMKRSDRNMSMKKKVLAAITITTMTIVSTISVSAATIGAANAYMHLYDATVVEEAVAEPLTIESDGVILYTASGLDEGFIEEEGEVIETYGARTSAVFEWEISKNRSKKTPGFSVTSGQTITVMVVSNPTDAVIHMGIIRPDGSRLYREGTGTFLQAFPTYADGTYNVYVQNLSDGSISVNGSYTVTD